MFFAVLHRLLTHLPSSFFSSGFSMQTMLFQHAVATPISILLSSIDEMEQDGKADSQTLLRVKLATKQLQQLTNDPLQVVKKPQKSNVQAVLRTMVAMLRSKNQNIILTDISHDSSLSVFPIQEIRLQEALTCIVNNALWANGDSGLPVHITYYREKSRYRIAIRDFGCGMNSLVKWVVHLPLFSLRKTGTGLGLFFAKQVIERELHGRLHIFSQPKQGTLVECLIPVTK